MGTFRWPKTEWGIALDHFKLRHNVSIVWIAEEAGVSLPALRQVMIGKTPGFEIKEKVNKFMREYEAANESKGFTALSER